MINEIKVIKGKFETIKILVGDRLSPEDLVYKKYLKVLIDTIENVYLHLNDVISEDLHICQQCAEKRNMLYEYLHLFDNIEIGMTPEDSEEKIAEFPAVIQQVIDCINTISVDHN